LPPCEMPADKVVAFVLGYLQVQAQAPLKLPRKVPRLGRHDCEGRADALELILRDLEGAQLSGAERTPVASEETQDEGPLRRSCSEEWRWPSASGRRKSGAVSPSFNGCDATSVSRSQPTRWLYAPSPRR
jgi:hypothetical protein